MKTLEQLEQIASLECKCTYGQLSGRAIGACRPCEATAIADRIREFIDDQVCFFFEHYPEP